MSNGKAITQVGRFPVPLRSTAPAEAAMLAELESLKGTYGAINERMREWLLRGLKELEQRTQQAPSTADDAASALAAVAHELNNSVAISQHFLSVYAQARDAATPAAKPRPMPVQQLPAPPKAAPVVTAPPPPAQDAEPAAEASEAAVAAERPRHSWAHLGGLVGKD